MGIQVGAAAAAAQDGYKANLGSIDQNWPLCYSYSEGLKMDESAKG